MRLEKLSRILAEDYRGPKTSLSEPDVLKAIATIGESGRLGRTKLSSTLDLGVGEIRTLIRRLRENGLIKVSAKGCELTDLGRKSYSELKKVIFWRSEVQGKSLGIGKHCWAFMIRGGSSKVKMGIEQRDAAIKAGASGVLTVLFSGGKFLIPVEGTDCESSRPTEPWITIRKSGPEEGDAIIVSGAEDTQGAERGGWSASMTLL